MRIRWSGITGSPTASGTTYEPGRTIDLQTAYDRAACHSEPTDEVEVIVELGDGTFERLHVDRRGSALLRRM